MSDIERPLRLFAVVPAAGHSRRMGRPKLLLPVGASTVIARMLSVLKRPEIASTIVVVRPDDEPLRAAVADCGAIPLQPDVPPPEMRQSVEYALRHIEGQFQPLPEDGWLLAPADHPLLDPAVVTRMVAEWRGSPGKIVVPVYRGRRGHPTLFPFLLAPEVFRLRPDQGLNSLLKMHATEIVEIDSDSPAVVADLDTPEDYARLLAEVVLEKRCAPDLDFGLDFHVRGGLARSGFMSSADQDTEGAQLPEDLPPVQPPSAGFIIQLFVVPGLIVLAIVGVWVLFGKLATGEQDWKGQLVELQHPNLHRRWRAASGLAQMVKADRDMSGGGQHLSRNREIAQALADVLSAEVKRGAQSDDDVKYETFLAATLGWFDLPDVVVPPLEQAMQPGIDREVRKNAIWAIAVIVERTGKDKDPLTFPELIDELTKVSRDDDPLIRQTSAFAFGLFPDEEARSRLEVMVADSDPDTRINAAIALTRHGDVRGAAVFEEVLKRAGERPEPGSDGEFEQFLALKNCIAAVERVAGAFNAAQRQELTTLLEPIAGGFREPAIRIAAKNALSTLRAER